MAINFAYSLNLLHFKELLTMIIAELIIIAINVINFIKTLFIVPQNFFS